MGLGQDAHQFLKGKTEKKCVIGGARFDDVPGFDADSDGDVIFHSLCNAISSVTHIPIMGKVAVDLCHRSGICDSACYLHEALKTLEGLVISHIAFSIEAKFPRLQNKLPLMRQNVAKIIAEYFPFTIEQVGITAVSGQNLTHFGQGLGVQALCIATFALLS